MSLTVFTQRNFVPDFLLEKCDLTPKTAVLLFKPPLGGLEATYNDHVKIIGKPAEDFRLVLIDLFSLGVTAEALRANIDFISAISPQRGQFDPKFQVEGVASHQPFFFLKKLG